MEPALLIDTLSWILLTLGGALAVIGAVGMLRFPDVFTRLHAAGITESSASIFILAGLMLQAGASLVSLRLLLILVFLLFTGPVAVHALARAALADNVKPQLANDSEEHE